MRIPLVLLVAALLAGACGDAPTDVRATPASSVPVTATSTTTLGVEATAAFVLGEPPDGYVAVLAEDRDGDTRIAYNAARACGTGISDWYANVEVTATFSFHEGRPADLPPHVLADGTEVEILELWDDGRPYGHGATWPLSDGRWVTVRFDEVFSVDELRIGIDSLVPVDAEDWARLTRALSIDTHVGRVGESTDDVTVDLDESGLAVTFHRPDEFPLGDDDCRRACHTLGIGGTGVMTCDQWAARVSVGERRFVAAQTAANVHTVVVQPGPGVNVADPTPRDATTIEVPGMPARFYAVEIPVDWCHHIVTTPDADFGRGLGEGGVTPSDPDRASCDFEVEPVPYEPPEVCQEAEYDWVASTTTLREVDCLDVPAAAVTTTTPPENDE